MRQAVPLLILILLFIGHTLFGEKDDDRAPAKRHPGRKLASISLLAMLALVPDYAGQIVTTPIAAANIHEQHRQLHKLVVDHIEGRVAANDIGWITYRNPHYVLDIFGLASRDARIARQSEASDWLQPLLERHGVEIIIAYDYIAADAADDWHRVATMESQRPNITPAHGTVTFYAVTESAKRDLVAELQRFESKLPEGVKLMFVGG